MSTPHALYSAVKPELNSLALPLFERSEKMLRERGYFLPHAAVLSSEGKVALLGAMCSTPGGFANSTHILPMLYQGLRSMAFERDLMAIGVAENVTVNTPDRTPTQAIKVLLEHREGLAVALYLPFLEETPGEYVFGASFMVFVEPEIKAWEP
jgi:hypothetical protein